MIKESINKEFSGATNAKYLDEINQAVIHICNYKKILLHEKVKSILYRARSDTRQKNLYSSVIIKSLPVIIGTLIGVIVAKW